MASTTNKLAVSAEINYEEAYYAKKDLLHAQLELLNVVTELLNVIIGYHQQQKNTHY